jgi:hypothetical protein
LQGGNSSLPPPLTFERDDDFSVERKMKVRIVYNPDAVVPFPPDVFNEPDDEQLN